MVLYGIPNCNTVKKAQDWLKAKGKAYEFHDFKKRGVTAERLHEWFSAFGWEKVLNRSGLTFKKLSKEEQAEINNADAAMHYLLKNTSAIKRPILELNGTSVLMGFNEADYEGKLKA